MTDFFLKTIWKKEFRKRFVTKIGGMKVVAARCETSSYPSYWDSKDLEVWIDQLLKEKDQECSIRVAAVKSNQAQLLTSQREELIEEIKKVAFKQYDPIEQQNYYEISGANLNVLKPARPQEPECDCICHWGIDKKCYSGSCEHCRESEKETTFDTPKDATDYLKKEIEEEKKLIMLQSDLARAIGHMQGCGHPDKYLENKYPDLVGKAQEEDQ